MPEETTTQETTTEQTETTETTPELIAGKFKDTDAFDTGFDSLVKHERIGLPQLAGMEFESQEQKVDVYKRLSSMMRSPVPKADSLDLTGDQQETAPPQPMSMQDLVAGVGANQEAINQAVMGGSALSDETYEQFGKAVITMPNGTKGTLSRELLDQVIGAQSQASKVKEFSMQVATQHVGSREQVDALIAFGKTLDPVTKQAISLELGNLTTMKGALDRLNHLYNKQIGADGSNGIFSDSQGAGVNLANKPFKNSEEAKAFRKEHGQDDKTYKSRLMATPNDVLNRVG